MLRLITVFTTRCKTYNQSVIVYLSLSWKFLVESCLQADQVPANISLILQPLVHPAPYMRGVPFMHDIQHDASLLSLLMHIPIWQLLVVEAAENHCTGGGKQRLPSSS
jgi:hypothetical protein